MQDNIDPITIAGNAIAALLGALVGVPISASMSHAMGTYSIIVAVAAIGASWALGEKSKTTRVAAIWYFLRVTTTAALLTVVIADLAGKWFIIETNLLIPVAFCIGLIGDNWTAVRKFFGDTAQRFMKSKTGGGE